MIIPVKLPWNLHFRCLGSPFWKHSRDKSDWLPGFGMTISYYIPINFTVMTFKYVEGGPDREAQEVVYLNVVT